MKPETIALHGGFDNDPATKAVAVPIYQTVAYAFDSADHGAALFNLEVEGFRYTRINNPTTAILEKRVAALEGGVEALCAASGQAALNYASLNVTTPGSNIVSVPQLYGTTHTLFAHVLPSQGIHVRFAKSDHAGDIAELIDAQTRAVYCESVGNPAGNICDIEELAHIAHEHGVPLIVDNTVPTPILLRPIDHGADIVVHSLTKFMGGHGTTLGGAVVDSGRFPWKEHADRFPMFNYPDASYHGLVYVDRFKEAAYIARCRSVYQRATGAVLSPLSAFLLLQGIETVALRIERHVENGRRVAEFLRSHRNVEWVNYAGFPDSPYYKLAQKYLGGRACSLMTFGIKGGLEAGKRFYDALRLFKRLVNLGDAKSLACHPASTTHRQMSPEEQRQRRSHSRAHPDKRRHRTLRRPCRRPRSGARRGERALMPICAGNPEDNGPSDPTILEVGFVNNMPDVAMDSTEQQFLSVLDEAAENRNVRVSRYVLPGLPRNGVVPNPRYAGIENLWSRSLDGLIVTGAEPKTANLEDEPYWASLARLVEWAEHHTFATVWSCLAAHAAVLQIDGIQRQRLGRKRFGVFDYVRTADHPLMAGVPAHLSMPHSRWNDVAEDALRAHGYAVLSRSESFGADVFIKQRKSLFVCFQGHPEYGRYAVAGIPARHQALSQARERRLSGYASRLLGSRDSRQVGAHKGARDPGAYRRYRSGLS